MYCSSGVAVLTAAGTTEKGLKPVFIEVDSPAMVKKLARMGLDIAAVRRLTAEKPGEETLFRVEAIISNRDEKKLESAGLAWQSAKNTTVSLQAFGKC